MKNYIFFSIASVFIFSSFLNTPDAPAKPEKSISLQKELYTKGNTALKAYDLERAYRFFYKSYVNAAKEDDSLYITRSLYKLAKIDYYNKDYITCEHHLIDAIKYVPGQYKLKYKLKYYNLMGVNLKDKANFKDATRYFNKYRQSYLHKKDTLLNFIVYANNMGRLYQKAKDYEKSIYYYNRLIQVLENKENLSVKYARAIDNKAWSLFNNKQYDSALALFIKAKNIRERIHDKPGLVMSFFHLGSFYQHNNQLFKAKEYSLKSLKMAENIGNVEGRLKALYLLSEIENPKGHLFFKQYKSLKDSLIEKERRFKYQSSRIRFESAENEAKIRLQKVRIANRNNIIFGISVASVIFAMSSLLFFLQKKKISKQKEHIQNLKSEVHHTAKNNLKMASVFVSKLKQEPSPEAFKVIERRIASMMLLHEILYKNDDNSERNLQDYIRGICDNLHAAYTAPQTKISYTIDIRAALPYQKATKMGLIVNELVTNIYKYAFKGKDEGRYEVSAAIIQGKFELIVADNGVGLPGNFQENKRKSYGMRMIEGLLAQIGGTMSYKSTKEKTEFRIVVSLDNQ